MYIRVREGLGQGQRGWSTLQTFYRPITQRTPPDYLGNFNEYIGQSGPASCEMRFIVQSFLPGKADLIAVQKKDIEDIAKAIVNVVKKTPPPQLTGKTRSEQPYVLFQIHIEGHVDKTTDPKVYGKLDVDRAEAVQDYLLERIGIEKGGLPFSIQASYTHSGLGPDFSVDKNPRKNRRAEVCIRGWEIRDPKRNELNVIFPYKSDKIQNGDVSKIMAWYKALPAPLRKKIEEGKVHINVWGRASTGNDSYDINLSLSRAIRVKKILQQAISSPRAPIFEHERGFGPQPTPDEKTDPKERSVNILVFDVITRIGRPWPSGRLSTLPSFR